MLRTLADVFAYADAHNVELRIDGTEVQVRRPKASRPGRRAFVSGRKKQNTIKPTQRRQGAAAVVRGDRSHPVSASRARSTSAAVV